MRVCFFNLKKYLIQTGASLTYLITSQHICFSVKAHIEKIHVCGKEGLAKTTSPEEATAGTDEHMADTHKPSSICLLYGLI